MLLNITTEYYYTKKKEFDYISFNEFLNNFDYNFKKNKIKDIYNCYELNIHNTTTGEEDIMNRFIKSIKTSN